MDAYAGGVEPDFSGHSVFCEACVSVATWECGYAVEVPVAHQLWFPVPGLGRHGATGLLERYGATFLWLLLCKREDFGSPHDETQVCCGDTGSGGDAKKFKVLVRVPVTDCVHGGARGCGGV